MSQPITRLYDNKKPALDAVSELKKNGFASAPITILTPADVKQGESSADDGLVASLTSAGVTKEAAAIYAARIRAGGSVVSVLPNWGTAQRATKILNSFGPVDAGLPSEVVAASSATVLATKGSAATLFSSQMNWPVLLSDPTPLSSRLKWPVLSAKTFITEVGKVSDLSNKGALFSNWFKWPVLSENPTPFSSWLNRPVLMDKAAPLSDWAKWPTISNNATPFSSWFKVRVLS